MSFVQPLIRGLILSALISSNFAVQAKDLIDKDDILRASLLLPDFQTLQERTRGGSKAFEYQADNRADDCQPANHHKGADNHFASSSIANF